MATLTTKYVPQPVVYKAVEDRPIKKSRTAKDVPLPEVPKVIDNGNGKRYFRGRLLGKVRLFHFYLHVLPFASRNYWPEKAIVHVYLPFFPAHRKTQISLKTTVGVISLVK